MTDLALMEVGKAALPYRLTGSQERVLQQILEDMQAPLPMLRLLQASDPPPRCQHAFPSCGVWIPQNWSMRWSCGPSSQTGHHSPFWVSAAEQSGTDVLCSEACEVRCQAVSCDMQGDVGCGKTVVAFLALLAAAGSGFQGAMMAPTEVGSCQDVTQAHTHCPRRHSALTPAVWRFCSWELLGRLLIPMLAHPSRSVATCCQRDCKCWSDT